MFAKNVDSKHGFSSRKLNGSTLGFLAEVYHLSSVLYNACRDLVDDAKTGCTDLVFKEVCLEILARAKHVLDNEEFTSLMQYVSERIEENTFVSIDAVGLGESNTRA
jgi:hypothetical protein